MIVISNAGLNTGVSIGGQGSVSPDLRPKWPSCKSPHFFDALNSGFYKPKSRLTGVRQFNCNKNSSQNVPELAILSSKIERKQHGEGHSPHPKPDPPRGEWDTPLHTVTHPILLVPSAPRSSRSPWFVSRLFKPWISPCAGIYKVRICGSFIAQHVPCPSVILVDEMAKRMKNFPVFRHH